MAITLLGKHFNLGTSTETVQWSNGNESIRYPIRDDADIVSRTGEPLPQSFLVDACLVVPRGFGTNLKLSSVHFGPGLVSASFSDKDGYGVCVCTVPVDSFEAYKPYPVQEVGGSGVSGTVSFGSTAVSSEPTTLKFDNCFLAESAMMEIPTGRLVKFVDDKSGNEAFGDVQFRVYGGVGLSEEKPSDATGLRDKFTFSLSQEADDNIVSPCEQEDLVLRVGEIPDIKSINGVKPDDQGRIAIVFM